MSVPLLRLQSVTISYPRNHEVVREVSTTVNPGCFIALLGPNGAGKSSLLRCAAGLTPPESGTVTLLGRSLYPPHALSPRERAATLAVVLTDPINPGLLRGWDLVISGRLPYRRLLSGLDEESRRIAMESLDRVEARHLAHRFLGELSDGERQRLLLARALAQEPRLLLLDEPGAFLDPPHQAELFNLIRKLLWEDVIDAAVVATHQLPLALEYTERLWLLSEGTLEEAKPEGAAAAIDRAFGHGAMRFDPQRRTFAPGSEKNSR